MILYNNRDCDTAKAISQLLFCNRMHTRIEENGSVDVRFDTRDGIKMSRVQDLTKGNIGKKLILFAIPMLLSSLVQQLYNTVDLIYAGNFLGKSASAAIGASSLLITCLVGFFGGMSVGSGVVVSHIYGTRNEEKLSKAVHNAVALCLAGGLLFMILGMFFAPLYLRLVNTPAELQASAAIYLRIYMLSFPVIFIYNIGSGVLRALGDSRSPLTAQFVGGFVNVAADYLFIRVFADGISGVAWATFISQSVAAALTLYHLSRLPETYRLQKRKIRFETSILKEVIRIGVPAGFQSLVITLSNVMAQYFINSFGENSIAAFTAYFKVELVIYLPIVAFGQAVMAFSGQCKGAEDYHRIRKGTGICLALSICVAGLTSVIALHGGEALFRIFNKDTAVIEEGLNIIRVTFPFYPVYCVLQVLGDSLRGCGRVKQPMLIVMLNICIVRTLLLWVLVPRTGSLQGVAVTYPITWVLTALCMTGYYIFYHSQKKEKKNIREEKPA